MKRFKLSMLALAALLLCNAAYGRSSISAERFRTCTSGAAFRSLTAACWLPT